MMDHIIIIVIAILVQLPGDLVRQENLKLGDHIYVYRRYGLYTHHGIYVGEGYVIHFTRTRVEETSLDSFQQEGEELHLYAYRLLHLWYWLMRWGTCMTLLEIKSPQDVVNKARDLHERNNFGEYDLINNNCEHFATFCQTGLRASTQTYLVSAYEWKIKEVKQWAMKFVPAKWDLVSNHP